VELLFLFLAGAGLGLAGTGCHEEQADGERRISNVTANGLDLAWVDGSDNESGFHIERDTGSGGTFSRIATVGANVTTYSSTGLAPSTTYCYRVQAYNSAGVSAYTNTACGTTLAPAALTLVFTADPASIAAGGSSTLSWSSANATSCTASAAPPDARWSGAQATSGTATVTGLSATTIFTLSCSGAGGTQARSATVTVQASAGETLLTTQTPTLLHNTDCATCDYELGMRFQSSVAGQLTAIRFWKDSSETGPHTGHIWGPTGVLLASVTFSAESASGWQTQALVTPVAVAPSTVHTVSVNTGNTYYVATVLGLRSRITSGHLRSIVRANGVYGPVGAYPSHSWNASNYFRDVVFVADP
jgi:hypothetical protein